MPHTLPSDVVRMIFTAFPWTATTHESPRPDLHDGPALAALVDLLDQLPEATLRLTPKQYMEYVWAASALRHLARQIEHPSRTPVPLWLWPTVGNQNAVTRLRLLLSECPDEGIEASTADLEFIDDGELRASVRSDISASEVALNNGEWKAATVLAGAALESLLLWSVMGHSEEERRSAVERSKCGVNARRPEAWHLHDYIEVAHELGDINENTVKQARLAKDFRNLIHPGREVRKQTKCGRATAHAAFAALSFAIADLEKRRARSE